MLIPQYDSLKQLSVSHEFYHSDDYSFLNGLFFSFHDFNFISSIQSCGSVDYVCLFGS
jgi:hypothetical protein